MPRPLIVCCCVGLTPAHLGRDTPRLTAFAEQGCSSAMTGVVPAVTCSAQATLATGVLPQVHGIVGNGWHLRDLGEIRFWSQSQGLIQAPSVWASIRRRRPLKVLKHFWWYALNSDCDAVVTPRPVYHHDGRKSPDFYAWPRDLKPAVRNKHGDFPLFSFWGPAAGLVSTRWIADSFPTAFDHVRPDLAWVYLPHLDYDLQRFGPNGPHLAGNLQDLDTCAATIIDHAAARGADLVFVSEYGLQPVSQALFPNRLLRGADLLTAVDNTAGELIDVGASRALAVCDHQIAHVSVRDHADIPAALDALRGCGRAYVGPARGELGLDHPRSGEIVLVAEPGTWFAYDYWQDLHDNCRRPDFARAVEIHKKPGYDPRELLFDPHGGRFRAMTALLRKKLGFRYVMEPCPLDTRLIKGSHGRPADNPQEGPLLIVGGSLADAGWRRSAWAMTDLAPQIERHFLG